MPTTQPQLDQASIATGKLRYVFPDFRLEAMHKQSQKTAEAAHCAGEQGKYCEMHDRLFANQQALAPKELAGHARAVGLKAGPFKKCLDSGGVADCQNQGRQREPTALFLHLTRI